jgi:hypothetical protein
MRLLARHCDEADHSNQSDDQYGNPRLEIQPHRAILLMFFRNHINFHHTYYSKDHLVSRTYLGDEGNNTPFFFIPVFLVGVCTYLVSPLALFVVRLYLGRRVFDRPFLDHLVDQAEILGHVGGHERVALQRVLDLLEGLPRVPRVYVI